MMKPWRRIHREQALPMEQAIVVTLVLIESTTRGSWQPLISSPLRVYLFPAPYKTNYLRVLFFLKPPCYQILCPGLKALRQNEQYDLITFNFHLQSPQQTPIIARNILHFPPIPQFQFRSRSQPLSRCLVSYPEPFLHPRLLQRREEQKETITFNYLPVFTGKKHSTRDSIALRCNQVVPQLSIIIPAWSTASRDRRQH